MVLSQLRSHTKQVLKLQDSTDISALLFELTQIEILFILDVVAIFFLVLVLFLRPLIPTPIQDSLSRSRIKNVSIVLSHLLLRCFMYLILVSTLTWLLFRLVDVRSIPEWNELYQKDLKKYVINPLLKSGMNPNQINRLLQSLHLKDLQGLRRNAVRGVMETTTSLLVDPEEIRKKGTKMFLESFVVLKDVAGENVSDMIHSATKWLLPKIWENAVSELPFGLRSILNIIHLTVNPLMELNASQMAIVKDLLIHNFSSFFRHTIGSYVQEVYENMEGSLFIAMGGASYLELSNLLKAFAAIKKALKPVQRPTQNSITVQKSNPTLQKRQALRVLQIDQKQPSPKQIRRAFLKLAALHHPDRGGDLQKMKQINMAYHALMS